MTIPGETGWLQDRDAQTVCEAVMNGGYRIYFVGGCVRNALLGLPDSDVDLSTNARPEAVMALSKEAGLKAVPTGIEHGTVTVVSGGKPFEVTTFRRDVATDGRRALVAFSDDIAEDARRRDFTMNALYATPKGTLVDPLGGLPDLLARRVRFIEDATARIREDYLRILRYFRFCAHYADPAAGFDPETLNAVAAQSEGLKTLSAERIGMEMRKLLAARDPAPALAAMRQTGVLARVLPGSDDRWLGILVHLEERLAQQPRWLTRLAALGGEAAAQRLRLSRAEARDLVLLQNLSSAAISVEEIAYRHGAQIAVAALLLRHAMRETLPETSVLEKVSAAAEQVFPIRATDLMRELRGPALGAALSRLETAWIESGFVLSRAELLDRV
ncbi:CCA tRNA nucleotidyltransferase [Sulfitobacter aestuarii]|uniref:CCA tRNA nucleotidyltransferase n=1 Tax=Sulfitobacter aestuarii TaxID=2161676 RepID=A0ABW5TY61_9RHOB